MKLTKTKLLETIRCKNEGYTTYQARKIAGISIRRVNQIWKEYLETGKIPKIGKKNGRPPKPIQDWEIQLVKEAYAKYRVSASTLEKCIEREHGKHINHNRIHKIMLNLGLAKKKDKKDIRKKKWIRYERRHSLTAVHVDWSEHKGTYVFGVEDDASRMILSLVECSSPTTNKSIEGMEEALQYGQIRQCINDHGTQFIKTLAEGNCRFKEYLQSKGIKTHRNAFKTKEEFLKWYNEIRPHRALKFNLLETPYQAFIRKKRKN